MASSRIEAAIENIVTEFSAISTANNYRNDIVRVVRGLRRVDTVTKCPELAVEVSDMRVDPIDDGFTTFVTTASITVIGVVENNLDTSEEAANLYNAAMSLLHDMMRVIGVIRVKYINANDPWLILNNRPVQILPPTFEGSKRTKAVTGVNFDIALRPENSDYGSTPAIQIDNIHHLRID